MVYFIFFAKRFFNFFITVFKVPKIFVLGLYIIFTWKEVSAQLETKIKFAKSSIEWFEPSQKTKSNPQ
jgi:hypothetical protein